MSRECAPLRWIMFLVQQIPVSYLPLLCGNVSIRNGITVNDHLWRSFIASLTRNMPPFSLTTESLRANMVNRDNRKKCCMSICAVTVIYNYICFFKCMNYGICFETPLFLRLSGKSASVVHVHFSSPRASVLYCKDASSTLFAVG